jgi:hypothetical protein
MLLLGTKQYLVKMCLSRRPIPATLDTIKILWDYPFQNEHSYSKQLTDEVALKRTTVGPTELMMQKATREGSGLPPPLHLECRTSKAAISAFNANCFGDTSDDGKLERLPGTRFVSPLQKTRLGAQRKSARKRCCRGRFSSMTSRKRCCRGRFSSMTSTRGITTELTSSLTSVMYA